jgi:signal transduction histidine kinase
MFAGARLRVIRLAAWVGWASLATIAVATVVHSRHTERAGHVVIWALLAGAALVQAGTAYAVPWRRLAERRVADHLLYGWVAGVLALIGLLLHLAGPDTGDFWLAYLLLILFSAAVFPPRAYLLIVVAALGSHLAIAAATSSIEELVVWTISILLLSALAGHLASEQRVAARAIAQLHDAMLALSTEPRPAALRSGLVARARRLTGAAEAVLAPARGGEAVVDPPGPVPDLAGLPIVDATLQPGAVLVGTDRQGRQALLIGVEWGASVLVLRGAEAGFGTSQYLLETLIAHAAGALESAQLLQELRSREHATASLVARLIGAQEEERRRLARELHDGVAQDLAGLVMGLEALKRAPGTTDVSELQRMARSAAEGVRELILDLRPRVLDDLGLGAALRWLVHERHPGLHVRLDVALDRHLPAPVETAMFRIVQEGLTNVERHAAATRVGLRVWSAGGEVGAVVEDDGRGFDPRVGTGGLGIVGMRERAEQLGGRLRIVSRSAAGTRLEVMLPLER